MKLGIRRSSVELTGSEQSCLEGGHLSNCRIVRELRSEDASSTAAIHLAAFQEMRLSLLGIHFLEQFYHRLFDSSDTIHLGIEFQDKIIGFACGGPRGYHKPILRNVKWALARAVLHQPWVILRLWSLTFSEPHVQLEVTRIDGEHLPIRLESLTTPIFELRVIAVEESVRNTGCADHLLTSFEECAKRKGARSIVLSVLKSNLAARRLYAKHGMCPVVENETKSGVHYGKSLGI